MKKESHQENKERSRKGFRICRPRNNKNSEMAANPVVYDDFEPSTEVLQEKDCETIIFNLPDFKKEQLRVQLTTANILRITGSRPITDSKWRRFRKEISVSDNCNMQKISAKFEGGKLYIRLPKLIVEEEKLDTKLTTPLLAQETSKIPASGGDPSKKPIIAAQDNVNTAAKEEPSAINTGKVPNDAKNVDQDGPEKKSSIANDEEKDKQTAYKTAKQDVKTRIDKYKETGNSVAAKLKAPRRVTSAVVAVILAVSIGLYITKLISSCKVDVICT